MKQKSCRRIALPSDCTIMRQARKRADSRLIIAGAGGAAHLPGMAAAMTPLPVLGVPVESKALSGSIACCPSPRCRAACRSARWRSARPGRSTPGCWRPSILALVDDGAGRAARRLAGGADRIGRRDAPSDRARRHHRDHRRRPARPDAGAGRGAARLQGATSSTRTSGPCAADVAARFHPRRIRRRGGAGALCRRLRRRHLRVRESAGRPARDASPTSCAPAPPASPSRRTAAPKSASSKTPAAAPAPWRPIDGPEDIAAARGGARPAAGAQDPARRL